MGFLTTFLVRRILQGVIIIVLVSFAIFAALRLVPGDPARIILGPMANDAAVETMAKQMGLRDSIVVQYVRWIGQVAHGDLGTSFIKTKGGTTSGGARDASMLGDKAHVAELLGQSIPV